MPGTSAPQTVTLTAGEEYGPITVEKSSWVRFKNLTPGMDLKFSYEPVNGRKSTGVSVVEGEAIKFTAHVKAIFLTSALGGTVTVDASDDFIIRPAAIFPGIPPAAPTPKILSSSFTGLYSAPGLLVFPGVAGKVCYVVGYSMSTDTVAQMQMTFDSGLFIGAGIFDANSGETKEFLIARSSGFQNDPIHLISSGGGASHVSGLVHYFLV